MAKKRGLHTYTSIATLLCQENPDTCLTRSEWWERVSKDARSHITKKSFDAMWSIFKGAGLVEEGPKKWDKHTGRGTSTLRLASDWKINRSLTKMVDHVRAYQTVRRQDYPSTQSAAQQRAAAARTAEDRAQQRANGADDVRLSVTVPEEALSREAGKPRLMLSFAAAKHLRDQLSKWVND